MVPQTLRYRSVSGTIGHLTTRWMGRPARVVAEAVTEACKSPGVIGTFNCLVIDCPEPRTLARFYEALLGLSRVEDGDEWVTLGTSEQPPRIAFQQVAGFAAPDWPRSAIPQQMHMDVLVLNLDVAQVAVLSLGAKLLEGSDKPIGYRVYADPAGHPFCLVTPEGLG